MLTPDGWNEILMLFVISFLRLGSRGPLCYSAKELWANFHWKCKKTTFSITMLCNVVAKLSVASALMAT